MEHIIIQRLLLSPWASLLIRRPRWFLWICKEKWFHKILSEKLLGLGPLNRYLLTDEKMVRPLASLWLLRKRLASRGPSVSPRQLLSAVVVESDMGPVFPGLYGVTYYCYHLCFEGPAWRGKKQASQGMRSAAWQSNSFQRCESISEKVQLPLWGRGKWKASEGGSTGM